ncbi:hypothetical protein, partial [Leyella stercorea]|uniref:hypothetical protein n=1 Tax=Leyella stercorea TaxID=363265 RepID=UPI00241F76B1
TNFTIKTESSQLKALNYICHTLHRNRNIIPPQPEHHSTTTGTSFHHNRNIIPPQPKHHFSTTGTTFSRHKH